jgi:hypothetical protein
MIIRVCFNFINPTTLRSLKVPFPFTFSYWYFVERIVSHDDDDDDAHEYLVYTVAVKAYGLARELVAVLYYWPECCSDRRQHYEGCRGSEVKLHEFLSSMDGRKLLFSLSNSFILGEEACVNREESGWMWGVFWRTVGDQNNSVAAGSWSSAAHISATELFLHITFRYSVRSVNTRTIKSPLPEAAAVFMLRPNGKHFHVYKHVVFTVPLQ